MVRENGGVSERQNTSMLKATSVLNGCKQLISDGTDDGDEVKSYFALHSNNATCPMTPPTLVSDGKAY